MRVPQHHKSLSLQAIGGITWASGHVSIVDEHTHECLGGMVERSITGERLIADLDGLAGQRGTYPAVLQCDNGPELACSAMADWSAGHVGLHFMPPGEPWRNGYVESFNSRIRDECLNINSFWSLAQAWVVISDWKHEYNHHRRHSSLGYQPPAATLPPAPTMNDSRSPWTSSQGPVTPGSAYFAPMPDQTRRPRPSSSTTTSHDIDAHQTIVFAALAVSHLIEVQTGWSIKQFARPARRYRTVTIQAGRQIVTAAEPPPDDLAQALDKIHRPGAHEPDNSQDQLAQGYPWFPAERPAQPILAERSHRRR